MEYRSPSEKQLQQMLNDLNHGGGMRPVDVIARFIGIQAPRPVKFRLPQEDVTVIVDRIISQSEDRRAGNRMIVYCCESEVRGVKRRYELKYEIATCRWYLCSG